MTDTVFNESDECDEDAPFDFDLEVTPVLHNMGITASIASVQDAFRKALNDSDLEFDDFWSLEEMDQRLAYQIQVFEEQGIEDDTMFLFRVLRAIIRPIIFK